MSRLIDADSLLLALDKRKSYELANGRNRAYGKGVRDAMKDVDDQPTVDAVPVVHGKWVESNPNNSDSCRLIKCSKCGYCYIVGFNVPYDIWIGNRNYCTSCGAKMDEPTQSNNSNTLDALGEKVKK